MYNYHSKTAPWTISGFDQTGITDLIHEVQNWFQPLLDKYLISITTLTGWDDYKRGQYLQGMSVGSRSSLPTSLHRDSDLDPSVTSLLVQPGEKQNQCDRQKSSGERYNEQLRPSMCPCSPWWEKQQSGEPAFCQCSRRTLLSIKVGFLLMLPCTCKPTPPVLLKCLHTFCLWPDLSTSVLGLLN